MPQTCSPGESDAVPKATFNENGISFLKHKGARSKCGIPCFQSSEDKLSHYTTRKISYRNVLFCTNLPAGKVELTYAVITESGLLVETDVVQFATYGEDASQDLASHLLSVSYGQSLIKPRILLLINNHGGQGNAHKYYQTNILPVLQAAQADISYMETRYSAHATEIAREMDISQCDIIACCSGDGVPHEVINGFYQRPDRAEALSKIAITQLPCGSGNALSLSTHGTNNPAFATLRMLKSRRARMDVMAVSQANSTKLSFLSQAYGAIADSDIGTENMRWMGAKRFDLGVTQRLLSKASYPCDIYVKYALKDKAAIKDYFVSHTNESCKDASEETHSKGVEANLQLKFPDITVPPPADWEQLPEEISQNLNIFYVGNMPYVSNKTQFFPAALPNDGCMEMIITSTQSSFFKMVNMLMSVENGAHMDSPDVLYSKVAAYRLVPRVTAENHYISVDGENFPFEPIQVEVLNKVMTVLLDDGAFVKTCLTRS